MTNFDYIHRMNAADLSWFLFCISSGDEDGYGDYDPHVVVDGHYFRDEHELHDWLCSQRE